MAKNKGWPGEPVRHGLAAKGIKTAKKPYRSQFYKMTTPKLLREFKRLDIELVRLAKTRELEETDRVGGLFGDVVYELGERDWMYDAETGKMVPPKEAWGPLGRKPKTAGEWREWRKWRYEQEDS